ncbi:DUF3017 domain-containing protein [Streptomyces jumonjinensis]|uniref:DUF3017 domain-containing protein n=1 Tax=Streptomyces jumonjinensis TaxID=1945 RepID=UPI0037ABEA96
MGVRMNDDRAAEGTGAAGAPEPGADTASGSGAEAAGTDAVSGSGSGTESRAEAESESGSGSEAGPPESQEPQESPDSQDSPDSTGPSDAVAGEDAQGTAGSAGPVETGHGPDAESGTDQPAGGSSSRRPPALTTDTARPEGGGRAAPGGAPAPARQWPLLTVLALVGAGLLIVGLDPFAEAFRIGTLLVGAGLLTGAVMRRVLPSVGMLAVRSRFTDMITYGVLGVAITLLALVAQPNPWLELPFLEDLVRFTVRGDETP